MLNVEAWRYVEYNHPNYGAHTICVRIGDVFLWFSYETCIAFQVPEVGIVTSENEWGTTTAKHLREIDSDWPEGALSRENFESYLRSILRQRGFEIG